MNISTISLYQSIQKNFVLLKSTNPDADVVYSVDLGSQFNYPAWIDGMSDVKVVSLEMGSKTFDECVAAEKSAGKCSKAIAKQAGMFFGVLLETFYTNENSVTGIVPSVHALNQCLRSGWVPDDKIKEEVIDIMVCLLASSDKECTSIAQKFLTHLLSHAALSHTILESILKNLKRNIYFGKSGGCHFTALQDSLNTFLKVGYRGYLQNAMRNIDLLNMDSRTPTTQTHLGGTAAAVAAAAAADPKAWLSTMKLGDSVEVLDKSAGLKWVVGQVVNINASKGTVQVEHHGITGASSSSSSGSGVSSGVSSGTIVTLKLTSNLLRQGNKEAQVAAAALAASRAAAPSSSSSSYAKPVGTDTASFSSSSSTAAAIAASAPVGARNSKRDAITAVMVSMIGDLMYGTESTVRGGDNSSLVCPYGACNHPKCNEGHRCYISPVPSASSRNRDDQMSSAAAVAADVNTKVNASDETFRKSAYCQYARTASFIKKIFKKKEESKQPNFLSYNVPVLCTSYVVGTVRVNVRSSSSVWSQ